MKSFQFCETLHLSSFKEAGGMGTLSCCAAEKFVLTFKINLRFEFRLFFYKN
jgi:hypothetical protein